MTASSARRERLQMLLELSRVSRGWSRARLARALGRDPTKLVPESGNPKLDYLVKLSEVLQWPVGEIVEAIWVGGERLGPEHATVDGSFEDLNDMVMASLRDGDHQRVIEVSREMFRIAKTGVERAHACVREAAGWDGLGRYTKVREAAQRGLRLPDLSVRLRLVLQATLANAQYTLWELTPALGTSEVLVRWYEANPPQRAVDKQRVAYTYYVRGHTRRRLMAMEPESALVHARAGRADLAHAMDMYEQMAGEFEDERLLGFANTCRAGLIELDVELGDRDPTATVEQLLEALDHPDPPVGPTTSDWRESLGWSCIFGSNIVLRHMTGSDLQRSLSAFLQRALEIAEELDNWSMRERVFTIQYSLHRLLVDSTGLDLDLTIDDHQRSRIGLTMGRFPGFRETGWQILETAKVIRS